MRCLQFSLFFNRFSFLTIFQQYFNLQFIWLVQQVDKLSLSLATTVLIHFGLSIFGTPTKGRYFVTRVDYSLFNQSKVYSLLKVTWFYINFYENLSDCEHFVPHCA